MIGQQLVSAGPSLRRWLRLAGPPLVAVLSHASHLPNGFTWLDHGDLEEARAVLQPTRLQEAFGQRFADTGFYRPLVTLTLSLDAAFHGRWAPGFHLSNLLLHVAVVTAVPPFLKAWLALGEAPAALAALVFAAHPATWIVGGIYWRPELLVTLLSLLSVTLHARARVRDCARSALAAGGCLLLALFSKETALFWVPALIVAWESWRGSGSRTGDRRSPAGRRTTALLLAAEGLALAVYLLLRAVSVPELWRVPARGLPFSQAAGTRLSALGALLAQLATFRLPDLSDATPIVPVTDPVALGVAALTVLAIAAGVRAGPGSAWRPALLLLGLALAPALNLVPLPRFRSPHYIYFPGIAVAALTALAWRHAPARGASGLAGGLVVLGLAGGVVTFAGGFRFRDDLRLFGPEVERDPAFLEGHAELGAYWLRHGELTRAVAHLEHARHPLPGVIAYVEPASVLVNLAGAWLGLGRLDEAERLLAEAAAAATSPAQRRLVAYDLALIAARRGDEARVADLLGGHREGWTRPEPLLLLARALARQGRVADSRAALRQALPLLSGAPRRAIEALLGPERPPP